MAKVPLPEGMCPARLTQRRLTSQGRSVWVGRLESPCQGGFLLLRGETGWQGWIGDHRLSNGRLLPRFGTSPPFAGDTVTVTSARIRPRLRSHSGAMATANEVRVMVLVSKGYADRYPGQALADRVDALFALANQGLQDSGVAFTWTPRLIAIPIDYPDDVDDGQALADLRAGVAPFDGVAALREENGADLVVFLRPLLDGRNSLCGLAPQNGADGTPLDPQIAQAVVRLERDSQGFVCDDLTLPHMLGHLMGLTHDPANVSREGALAYAHGHGENGLFGTVMSEIAPWLNRWSSPDQICLGRPCGVAGVADNVRALGELAPQVAAFRGGTALPPGAPTATTEPADAIGPEGATLHATVDPAGQAVSVLFRYGTDLTLPFFTLPQDLPAVSGPVPIQASLTGLQCATRYLYRVEVTVNGRVIQGLNSSFTTAPCDTSPPPSGTTLPVPQVLEVGRSSALFRVLLDPSSRVSRGWFEYGPTGMEQRTPAQGLAGGSSQRLEAFVGDLNCASDYQVRLVLEGLDGVRQESQTSAFTTLACMDAASPVVTLEPAALGERWAELRGSVDPGGTATLAWFEYGPPQAVDLQRTPAIELGQATRPKEVRWLITGLDCGTPYAYRLLAAAADGQGNPIGEPLAGGVIPFTTLECPLPQIRNEHVVWANAYDATVAATVLTATGGGEVVFQYGTTPAFGQFSETLPLLGPTAQTVLRELQCGTLYYFRAVVTLGGLVIQGVGNSFATAPCPDPPEVATVEGPETTPTSAALRARVLPNGSPTRVWFEYGPELDYGQRTPARLLAADSPGEEVEAWVLGLDCGATYHARAVAENEQGRREGEDVTFLTAPCRPPAQAPPPRLSAGGTRSLAFDARRQVLEWGNGMPLPRQFPDLGVVSQLAGGGDFALALGRDGALWSWGNGDRGQLGDGTLEGADLPRRILARIETMAAGGAHALALRGDGTVLAWGAGERGQLGDGQGRDSPLPVPVPVGVPVTAVAAGGRHSAAIDSRGRLWMWGDNERGQLGQNGVTRLLRPRLGPLDQVRAVVLGDAFTLALRSDGTLWSWGANERGQLGDGSFTDRSRPRPLRDEQGRLIYDVVAMAAGRDFALALRSDGTILAWGANDLGQVAVAGGEDQPLPRPVLDPQGRVMEKIRGLAAGNAHALALASDGAVWGWGDDSQGQLAGLGGGASPGRLTTPQGETLRLSASRLLVEPRVSSWREGETLTLTVRPDGEPLGPLLVNVRLEGDAERVVLTDSRPLFFDTSQWDQPLEVTLEALSDMDGTDEQVVLVLTSSELPETRLDLRVEDDDAPPSRGALAPLGWVLVMVLVGWKRRRAASAARHGMGSSLPNQRKPSSEV